MSERWHWIKVGSNPVYVAVVDGRVEAVVYRTAGETGTDESGQPVVTEPGWCWFPADRSNAHEDLVLGPLPSEQETTLDPSHDAALDAATPVIEQYLGIAQ